LLNLSRKEEKEEEAGWEWGRYGEILWHMMMMMMMMIQGALGVVLHFIIGLQIQVHRQKEERS
jgi:hypothetical protein